VRNKPDNPLRKEGNQMAELDQNELNGVVGGADNKKNIPDYYIVQPGDCLSTIAQKFNTTWQELYRINKKEIDETAKAHGVKSNFQNYIYPNQKLKLHD
jgi:LysM repeat protein